MNFKVGNRASDAGVPSVRISVNRNTQGTLTFEICEQGECLEGPSSLFFDVAEETLVGGVIDDYAYLGSGPPPGRTAAGHGTPDDRSHGCISVLYESVDAHGRFGMETLTLTMGSHALRTGARMPGPSGGLPEPVEKVPSSVAFSIDDGEVTTSLIQIGPAQDAAATRSLRELDTAAFLATHQEDGRAHQGDGGVERKRARGARLRGRVHLVGVSMHNGWWRQQAKQQKVGRLSSAGTSILQGRPLV